MVFLGEALGLPTFTYTACLNLILFKSLFFTFQEMFRILFYFISA